MHIIRRSAKQNEFLVFFIQFSAELNEKKGHLLNYKTARVTYYV